MIQSFIFYLYFILLDNNIDKLLWKIQFNENRKKILHNRKLKIFKFNNNFFSYVSKDRLSTENSWTRWSVTTLALETGTRKSLSRREWRSQIRFQCLTQLKKFRVYKLRTETRELVSGVNRHLTPKHETRLFVTSKHNSSWIPLFFKLRTCCNCDCAKILFVIA